MYCFSHCWVAYQTFGQLYNVSNTTVKMNPSFVKNTFCSLKLNASTLPAESLINHLCEGFLTVWIQDL